MSNDGGSVARRRTYLMRRGDVKYFVTDQEPAAPRAVELTRLGREQAQVAGHALRAVRFDQVITSGLSRVIEIARIVLDASENVDQPEIETWPEFEEVDAAFFSVLHSATPDRDSSYLYGLEQTPECINVLDHGPDWFVRAVNVGPDDPAHVGPRVSSLEEIADVYRAYRGYPVPGPR